MSLAINVEPYDPEMMEVASSPRNEKKSKKDKRGCGGCCCGMSLWLTIVCIIAACALVIAVVLTAYFLIDRKPEPPHIPTGTPPSTTMTPISPTVPPNETTSTAPCIPIRWLEDLPVRLPNNDLRRVSLFNGQASHSAMRIVCDKIDYDRSLTYEDHVRGRHIEYRGIVNFDKAEEEASFNEMIHSYDSISTGTIRTIFGNLPAANRLMWNGCYYTHNGNTMNWDNECSQNPLKDYNNFCDQLGWMKELEDLKSSATKHNIFVVKDYRGDNKGCWQLYTEQQILSIKGSKGINARLPFACITANMSSISGKDALTQSGIPCHRQ